ncbi:MAG: hypothetical protein H0U63_00920 [Burkholderiales bacterium]|nr:hypothetical protein [Burkholderiales bacterium]
MLNLPISRDGFLWAFSIASQIHRVPLAPTFLLNKHEAPFTLGSFRVAAERTGFRIRQKAVPNSQLEKLPLPCLVTLIPHMDAAKCDDDMARGPATIREYQLALLERIDEKWVVLAEACAKSSLTMSREAFERRFAGEALIIAPQVGATQGAKSDKNALPSNKSVDGKFGTASFAMPLSWLKTMFRIAR